jgi:pSer/pThr/pTyr-binding forkhead associated (FHA) protein
MEGLVLAMIPSLVAIDGPLPGRTFYLDESLVSIGRLESSDIRLDDLYVSRHHCVIRSESEEYLIEDLNSANGTYVNGELIKACSLEEGTIIEIGTSRFLFKLQNPEETMAVSQNLISPNGERPLSGSARPG